MTIDFSNIALFNKIYLPLLNDRRRYKIIYGGRDSGKSDFVAQSAIISMLSQPFFRMILIRRYYSSIKQSQFQTIIDFIRKYGLSSLFHLTLNPLTILCPSNGNLIIARGLDQPDNTKSIKDPTCLWFEEADQISEEAFSQASLSLRSSHCQQLSEWLTFNPRHENLWINRLFFPVKNSYETPSGSFHWVPSPNPDAVILHTTYKDNRFCPPDRARRLESLKFRDENFYNVNTLGLWGGALKGLIFPAWTAVESIPDGGDRVFGLDYGFNNPSALTLVSNKDGCLYLREIFYLTNHTHQQIVSLLLDTLKPLVARSIIIVDSEEPALVSALRSAGFNARPADKGPASVYNGIMLCKQFDLFITKDSPNLIREIRSYVWKHDKLGNPTDDPVKVDDHALDAFRYVVQTYGRKYWLRSRLSANTAKISRKTRIDDFSGF